MMEPIRISASEVRQKLDSGSAVLLFAYDGFQNAVILGGGVEGWKNFGFPLAE